MKDFWHLITLQERLVTYNIHQDFMEITRTTERAGRLLDLLLSGTSYRYEVFCDYCKEEREDLYEMLFISDYNAQTEKSSDTIKTDGSAGNINWYTIIYNNMNFISPNACSDY